MAPCRAACELTCSVIVSHFWVASHQSGTAHTTFKAVSSCHGRALWQILCQWLYLMLQCCVCQELDTLLQCLAVTSGA